MEAQRFVGDEARPIRGLLPVASDSPVAHLAVRAVCADSRAVRPGDLFVAIRGYQADGHAFLKQAAIRGAIAAVVERLVSNVEITQIQVSDTRAAFAQLCWGLLGDSLGGLDLIGVTGTNGKSTTAWLTRAILERAGCRVALLGTIVWQSGSTVRPARLTTPGPAELARFFRHAIRAGCRTVVMEVSSHALSLRRCVGLQFAAAAYLGLSRDHLDFHGSMEAYAEAKARLFAMLRRDGIAAALGSDRWASTVVRDAVERCLWYGFEEWNHVRARVLHADLRGTHFAIVSPWWTGTCTVRLPGPHNVINALAAATLAGALGVDLPTIRSGLAAAGTVPGRLERITPPEHVHVFVDYAHTPDALRTVLDCLRRYKSPNSRLLVVFGAGGDRDRSKRPLMGRVASERAELVIITDDNPRTEDPEVIVADILQGCSSPANIIVCHNRARAIETALDLAQPGDVVLIAGKGHETEQIIGSVRVPFDDREVVRAWWRRKQGAGGQQQRRGA